MRSPDHIAIECGHCKRLVSASVAGTHSKFHDETDTDFRSLLAGCPSCGGANLASQWVYYELNYDGALEVASESQPLRLWPHPARTLSEYAPMQAQADFAEAWQCMASGAHTAAAVMARRVLEGVVADQGGSGRNLSADLKALGAAGTIDSRLAEWAEALRLVGNSAAHASGAPVTEEDARDVLAFAEALGDYVYTFRFRFEEFRRRRHPEARSEGEASTGEPGPDR